MSFNYKNPVCKGSWQFGNNCKTCERCVETFIAPAYGSKPDMTDAYNGAREEVEIWKKRALEAEAKLLTANFESNFWKKKTLDAETKVALLTKELDQETIDTLYRKMTENPITVRYSSYHWFLSGAVVAQQFSKTFADESLAATSKS
jgi:membrane-bound lytic murein transglycosylase